ncbi:ABC transporter permease [Runella sp.]|uniref:ABC transporter permease n=1 Tax=Runella sp. TaxID=1960881 RepID=UPI003D0D25A3
MKTSATSPQPPRWAQRFLRWYCRAELLEDLQGDLNEFFDRNLKAKGAKRARFIYCLDVLKFFRFYTVRKFDFFHPIIPWIMISSYFKTSRRSLVRNKLFSAINIIGLSISMSVGLLLIAFLTDLLSYDDFHEKKDRIYRIITTSQRPGQRPMELVSGSVKTGKKIKNELPGVEKTTLIRWGFGGDAQIGDTKIPLSGLWADNDFYKVFSFSLLKGDPNTALKEPYSLVLTEKTAKKLFGDTDALGKSIRFDTLNYVVTGIMKDIPKLSHLRFEALVSYATIELQNPGGADGDFLSWENIYSNFTYLVLPKNGNRQTLQDRLNQFSNQENKNIKNHIISLSLQPLSEVVIGNRVENSIGPTINRIAIWILSGLVVVVILSACFNYTNLSIARSLRRSREVGIRKVIGALKGHVLGQFIMESVLISLLALAFSFILFLFLRTQFLSLAPQISDLISLELSPLLIVYFIGFSIFVGILAGFLPALFFARIKAVQVMKDMASLQLFRRVTMRKVLIVVQYTLSLIFITTTVIGYNQYKSFLVFDLGFTTENILNIRMQGNKAEVFKKELAALPAVSDISTSRMITSLGSKYGMSMKYQTDSTGVWLNFVDEKYFPIHKHQFLAGSNFRTRPKNGEETEVIVNEQLLKRFNIAKRLPVKAIGKQLITPEGKHLSIVGVVKDFHYGTLEDKIEPLVFRYSSEESGGYLNVKISSNDLPGAMESIKEAWKRIDKTHPLDARFYDDQIEEAYRQFSVMVKVIGFLAFLAICIASMGLFGMVVFTTETKLKEISIRKVLGANEFTLVYLLSKGFLMLLILSALIALPATYFFFEQVVLTKFAYHQSISLAELLAGVLAVMTLAFLLIGSQTLKVARSNPAKVLKSE